jgi:hypothetical protein
VKFAKVTLISAKGQLQRKVAIFAWFWMQLDCILLAVQLLANGKLLDLAL